MASAVTSPGPLISAWAAVSPWGLDSTDFSTGLRERRSTATPLDREAWNVPRHEACLVPDFDIKRILGRKGTRSMDRATGLAVTALGRLLRPEGERLAGVTEETGLALGTSTGSAQSIMDFTRDSLVGAKPFFVDPARFPNTVMNCAAGQSAIWHRLQGPNTTIAGGRATGLLALRYAMRLQRAGRAPAVLCGAVEEFSPGRAWLDWHARADAGRADGEEVPPLGEGAAAWLVESGERAREHGRTGIAQVLGLEFGFAATAEDVRPALTECVRRLLESSGVAAEEIWAVAGTGGSGHDGRAERLALREALAGHEARDVSCAELVGDTYAASSAFQMAAVLSLAEERGSHDRIALVTSVESGAAVGSALVRLLGTR